MADIEELRRRIEENSALMKSMTEQRETIGIKARTEREFAAEERRSSVQKTPGRMGLVDPSRRQAVRQGVEGQGFGTRMLAEAAPGTLGAAIGGGLGALGGPAAFATVPAGAAVGGFLGELAGQELGITPESDVGLGVAAAAPVVGSIAGAGARALGRGGSAVIRGLPQGKQAAGRVAGQEASEIVEAMGSNLFAKQRGLVSRSADDLFDTLKRSDPAQTWNQIPNGFLANTRKTLEKIKGEGFDEVKQIFAADNAEAVTFRDIAATRAALLETAVRGSAADKKAARSMLSSLERDMDNITSQVVPQRGMATMTKSAIRRQKLEFAVQDLDQLAMKSTNPVEGSEDLFKLNITKLRKDLLDKTDPRSARYDPDFAEGLGPIKEEMNKELARLEKILIEGKPGGPGSLIIQGRAAAGGAMAGGLLAGPLGAGIGAITATSAPRMFVRAMSNPKSRIYIKNIAKIGRGNMNHERWSTLMEITAQSALSAGRQTGEEFE